MKALLSIMILLACVACRSADGTNITFKVTVDATVNNITTTTTATLKLDGSTAKDTLMAAALIAAHEKAVKDGSQLGLADWLKQDVKDRVSYCTQQKLASDNANVLSKIQTLLFQQQDNLTSQEMQQLQSIASKAQ